MPVTAAPSDETSLMRREEIYVYFSWGMRKTVYTVWRSFRFMRAIWKPYSKSDTKVFFMLDWKITVGNTGRG